MTTKMHNTWYCIPSNEDICHYGILGMKWGIRRYQNDDGSLTPAGRKRYNSNNIFNKNIKKKLQPGVEKYAQKEIEAYNNELKKFEKIKEDYVSERKELINSINGLRTEGVNPKDITPRMYKAADLGLKALSKSGRIDIKDVKDKEVINWFLFDDQTVAYPFWADQVAQGKSMIEINHIIDKARKQDEKLYNSLTKIEDMRYNLLDLNIQTDSPKIPYDLIHDEIDFYLSTYISQTFIENCIAIKKNS